MAIQAWAMDTLKDVNTKMVIQWYAYQISSSSSQAAVHGNI